MKKGRYVLILVLIFVVLIAAAVVSFVFVEFGGAPRIPQASYLEIGLAGPLVEFAETNILSTLVGTGEALSMNEIWTVLRMAAVDDRIAGVLVRMGPLDCDWAKCAEIRDALVRFRTSGKKAIAYIEETPQIRDVLLSGGDPLTMTDGHLDYLLSSISRIPHVEVIRIGTKVPVVLPQRMTARLLNILKKYQPLWISIHLTHPDELTPETKAACNLLADAGIPLGSQTVLLKGINDNVETLKALFHGLMKIRVRPYYLYQCDPILGSSHFRTTIEKGIEMIEGLRGHTTGYAVPHYVVDAPGGGGKIPLLPDYYQGRDADEVILRNYEGRTFRYPDKRTECPAAP